MRVLVFGNGSMGRRHALNAQALGHDVLVCDEFASDMSIATAPYRISRYPPWDLHVDAVVIAAPTPVHAELFVSAKLRGLPVLVEKPLAMSVAQLATEDVRHWTDASRRSYDARDMVGYNLRYHPGLIALRESLKDGFDVTLAEFTVRSDKSKWPGRHYEDMLLEASHEIDAALWLLGPAQCAAAQRVRDDCWVLLLVHSERGAVSVVTLDGTYGSYMRRWSVSGPAGVRECYWTDGVLGWRWNLRGPGVDMSSHAPPDALYMLELQDFLSGLGVGVRSALACDELQAIATLAICDEARRLAK